MKGEYLLALFVLPLFVPTVLAHDINVPTNVHFGIPAYGTYIDFSSAQTFDTVYRQNNYWYFDTYGFQVQQANMTISTFFQNNKLIFTVDADSGTSTSKIYVADKSKPTSVSGATSWSYDSNTKICTITVTHPSSQEVVLDWTVKIPGDVTGDGIVDIYDLARVGKAYGATPGDPNWDEEADINGDGMVGEADLTLACKNYGKTLP